MKFFEFQTLMSCFLITNQNFKSSFAALGNALEVEVVVFALGLSKVRLSASKSVEVELRRRRLTGNYERAEGKAGA